MSHLALLIMLALAVLTTLAGWPLLATPAQVRRLFGWSATPQSVYVLRIGGTMLLAMGITLFVFVVSWTIFAAP